MKWGRLLTMGKLIDNWIHYLETGLIAHFVDSLTDKYSFFEDSILLPFREYIKSLDPIKLRKMPPTTLQMIENALIKNGRKLGKKVNVAEALDKLDKNNTFLYQKEHDDVPSVFGRAQIWAYFCLLNDNDADTLLLLGADLFKNCSTKWHEVRNNPELLKEIEMHLNTIRSPLSSTEFRVESINVLTTYLGGFTEWDQIANILFHHQYTWPLLIINNVSTSLPVAVDIKYDYKNTLEIKVDHNSTSINPNTWRQHLKKSVQVGKQLWRSKHGNHGQFKYQVENASVIFDFSLAAQILNGKGHLNISGGSAEAYFAEVVLNRLLGRSHMVSTAVTGLIGNQIKNEETGENLLNYELLLPEDISKKISYVFSSQLFERVAIPTTNEDVQNEISKLLTNEIQTAQIFQANDMHTLSDIFQTRGWRQYQYSRCPDISWAIHSDRQGNPGLLDREDPRVIEVFNKLRSEQSVVQMPKNTNPLAIASALWYVNNYYKRRLLPQPPSISWSFIRVLEGEYEQDERFWKLIWQATGAPDYDFYDFVKTADSYQAMQKVKDVLNNFEPSENGPGFRSPDIIVILGTKHLKKSLEKMTNPKCRPFMPLPIISMMEGELHPIIQSEFHRYIGNTRIILVEEDYYEAEKQNEEGVTLEEKNYLHCLSMFQSGFTEREATLIINYEFDKDLKRTECREQILEPLVNRDLIRRGQGRYHVPRHVIEEFIENPDDNKNLKFTKGQLSKRHFMIGCILAPFVSGNSYLHTLAIDTKFDSVYMNEARRHFYLANKYAQQSKDTDFAMKIRKINLNLTSFVEFPNWSMIQELTRAGRYPENLRAFRLSSKLLLWQEEKGIVHHPNHYLYTANAAKQLLATEKFPSKREKWKNEANHYFKKAISQCNKFESEKDINLLHVLTEYIVYLLQREPRRTNEILNMSATAKKIAERLIASNIPLKTASAEWIEYMGDREKSHTKALSIYKWGIDADLHWAQLWIKYLGCAEIGNDNTPIQEIQDKIIENSHFLSRARTFNKKNIDSYPPHVKQRWRYGKEAIKSLNIQIDELKENWSRTMEKIGR